MQMARSDKSPVADADDVRRPAPALPHVEEIDSDGFDFRVGGKGFVWSYPERRPGKPRLIRTDIAVLYAGDEAVVLGLLGRVEAFTAGQAGEDAAAEAAATAIQVRDQDLDGSSALDHPGFVGCGASNKPGVVQGRACSRPCRLLARPPGPLPRHPRDLLMREQ